MAPADNPFEAFFNLIPTGAALYAPIVDAGGDVVDFRFVRLNPAGQRLLGLPALPANTFREQYPHSVPTGIFAQYREAYLTGQSSTYDVPYAGDGIDTYFRLVAQRSGELLIVNFTDMADLPRSAVEDSLRLDRARAQQAGAEAKRQRAELQVVFEQAPMAMAMLRGPKFLVEWANTRMGQIWGRPLHQLLGRPHFQALPDLAGQGFEQVFATVFETGQPYYLQELLVHIEQAHQSYQGYFNITYQPLYEEQRITGILASALEVTDQVLARQQVQHLNQELATINEELQATNGEYLATNTTLSRVQQQLQQLNQELEERVRVRTQELWELNRQLTRTNVDLDTFVYTASHDLKAPITNIESIALALRDTLPAVVQQDEVVTHLLDLLDKTVGRFQFTIAQLTDISRLQLAQVGPSEPVLLAAVVEDVRLDLTPLLDAAQTKLVIEIASDLVVTFSPANLRSIIYNLLSNAIKYRASDRPSRVQVRATRTAQAVVLAVQDNGLGLSALQQGQLFGLFHRLHTHVEGTGVGLYISKRLIENGGGTIAVESQSDAGTTFTVTFPT